MEDTLEQIEKKINQHRKNMIREIDYLIDDLQEARGWLVNRDGYGVDGRPESRLERVRKEQYQAEALASLADHIRYEEAVKRARAEG
jgi:hypothetical protein